MLRMKKAYALVFSALLFLPSLSFSLELQLRLSSGLRQMKLGQVNLALAGWEERTQKEASLQPDWSLAGGPVPELRFGFTFEGELTFFLSSRLALGLNAGYVYGGLDEQDTLLSITQESTTTSLARPTKISAYPVTLLGYIFFPLGSKFHFYLKGGGGIIQSKYVSREAVKLAAATKFVYPVLDLAEARGTTYLGGIGFDYKFDASLGFFIEATVQSSKVGEFSGENQLGEKGDLYSFEEYVPELDFWQNKMQILPQMPGGASVRSVRKAMIDFSGFSVKIGVLLKF